MSDFLPESFFELDQFPYRLAIREQKPVWESLSLDEFFETFFSHQHPSLDGEISEKAHIEGQVHIEEGAKVEAGAFIKGPCLIGAGTEVRHGAYLRGNVVAGKNCVIGHSTEVKNSIFLNGAKAGHFAYVGDSILGNNVNLGAGTKLANLKVTSGNIIIRNAEERIDSGRRKFGAILADGFQSGCNSVTNPGFIAAKDSIVYPCVAASGQHLTRSLIRK